MRTSTNQVNSDGILINGYDYHNQAWVLDGVYQRCGHPEEMDCDCYGRIHAGEHTQLVDPEDLTQEQMKAMAQWSGRA